MRLLIAFTAVILSTHAQTATIEGRVENSITGAPVREASIVLRGPFQYKVLGPGRNSTTATEAATEAVTDDRGQFRFSKLAAGNYELRANHSGYDPTIVGKRGVAQELTPLAAGQQLTDFVIKLPPTATVTGKVFDERGEPIQGATVIVEPPNTAPGLYSMTFSRRPYPTDDRGIYRISSVPAGSYFLNVQLPDSLRTPADASGMAYGPSNAPETGTFALAPGEVRSVDIHLHRQPMRRLQGRLIGPNGLGKGPGMIYLAPIGSQVMSQFPVAVDGNFDFWAPPGAYQLATMVRDGGGTFTGDLPIDLRTNVDALRVRLSTTINVNGRIKFDGSGTIDPHRIQVQIIPYFFAPSVRPASLAPDLSFILAGVSSASFTVRLSNLPDDFFVKSVQYAGKELPASGFQVVNGGQLAIVIGTAGARLDGIVRDKTGNPSPSVSVTMLPLDDVAMSAEDGYTDAEGRFSFHTVRPGRYKVQAWDTTAVALGLQQPGDLLKPFDARSTTVALKAGRRETVEVILITEEERRAVFSSK